MKLILILLCSALLGQEPVSEVQFSDRLPGCVESPEQTDSSGFVWRTSCNRTIGYMSLKPKGWVIKITKGYGFGDLFRVAGVLPSLPYADTLVKEVERRMKMKRHFSVLRVEEKE